MVDCSQVSDELNISFTDAQHDHYNFYLVVEPISGSICPKVLRCLVIHGLQPSFNIHPCEPDRMSPQSHSDDCLSRPHTQLACHRALLLLPTALDDSAQVLFLTEVWRGMMYTLGAFFDKKVTVSERTKHMTGA